MKPPPFRAEEAREWLRLAARDLRMSELALADTAPLTGESLFHAQQAAEKALKGFLVYHNVQYLLPTTSANSWIFVRRSILPSTRRLPPRLI